MIGGHYNCQTSLRPLSLSDASEFRFSQICFSFFKNGVLTFTLGLCSRLATNLMEILGITNSTMCCFS